MTDFALHAQSEIPAVIDIYIHVWYFCEEQIVILTGQESFKRLFFYIREASLLIASTGVAE